ncbi:hypothetical protein DERP_010527 [Dermatophagoides pteronyssinus]|uniref:Uncharacterized protein n=1 Tax=Dermatophagoides pteronyssinus TaxID=6956 RepID=A0ABQ8JG74_DERPT|nr:hypothetical protein DERP_010527 [Dermatophagoides pteronyssinus]
MGITLGFIFTVAISINVRLCQKNLGENVSDLIIRFEFTFNILSKIMITFSQVPSTQYSNTH